MSSKHGVGVEVHTMLFSMGNVEFDGLVLAFNWDFIVLMYS